MLIPVIIQFRFWGSLHLCGILIIAVENMVPVNRSILVDGWQADAIRQSVIGRNLDKRGFWVFIIVHNLRHRCGDTACEGQVTTRYQRTQTIVWCCLTPCARNEGSNGMMVRNGSQSH